jgi:hypothetical protein
VTDKIDRRAKRKIEALEAELRTTREQLVVAMAMTLCRTRLDNVLRHLTNLKITREALRRLP